MSNGVSFCNCAIFHSILRIIHGFYFLGYYNFVFRAPEGARDFKVVQRSGTRKPDTVALGMECVVVVVVAAVLWCYRLPYFHMIFNYMPNSSSTFIFTAKHSRVFCMLFPSLDTMLILSLSM